MTKISDKVLGRRLSDLVAPHAKTPNEVCAVCIGPCRELTGDTISVSLPTEAVDHPQHYGGKDDPYEHVKVCEAKGWGYHIGNCTKYLWRAGKKGNVLEDLKKARWYLDRYIALLEEGK